MIILQSERLILRESVPGDLEDLLELLSDPRVMEFYPEPLDRQGALAWILKNRERYACHGFGIWNAHARADGSFLGLIGLAPMQPEGRPDASVAYLLLPRYSAPGLRHRGGGRLPRLCLDPSEVPARDLHGPSGEPPFGTRGGTRRFPSQRRMRAGRLQTSDLRFRESLVRINTP